MKWGEVQQIPYRAALFLVISALVLYGRHSLSTQHEQLGLLLGIVSAATFITYGIYSRRLQLSEKNSSHVKHDSPHEALIDVLLSVVGLLSVLIVYLFYSVFPLTESLVVLLLASLVLVLAGIISSIRQMMTQSPLRR